MDDQKESKNINEKHLPNGLSRRNLVRGLAATPVVMSVASRPVWAAGCSISGQLSGNLSNPDKNDCTARAEAKSPDYWCKWKDVYDFIKSIGCKGWNNLSTSQQDSFGTYTQSLDVLYNWSLTEFDPKDSTGITAIGSDICKFGTGDQLVAAALLCASHPNIDFPYAGSQWTVPYIVSKYASIIPNEQNQLLITLGELLSSPSDPTLPTLGKTGQQAYHWAKNYLGLSSSTCN